MRQLQFEELLEAGCHFGHLRRKWCPNMAPYIYLEHKRIHVINLHKTIAMAEESAKAIKEIAKANKKILFVGTKKQAKDVVAEAGKKTNMPYIVERWPGGLLTNFATIKKAIKKITNIEKLINDDDFASFSKRERLQIIREKAKLEKTFGSIMSLTRIPSALFVVDIVKEHIAVAEARKLNIPIFAIVDTNADPLKVTYPIPANDDSTKSISVILSYITEAILEGLNEISTEKEQYIEQQLLNQEESERIDISTTKKFEEELTDEVLKQKIKSIKFQIDEENE